MTNVIGYYWVEIISTKEITIIKLFTDRTYIKMGCKKKYSINDYVKNDKHIICKEKINILSKDLRNNKIG